MRPPTKAYQEKVLLLKEFYQHYHRLPKKHEKFKDYSLGVWTCNQRYLCRVNKLSKEHIALFSGVPIFKTGSYHFRTRVSAVNDFYQKYQRLPFRDEVIRGIHLGEWWYAIKVRIWNYDLSEEDTQYLEKNAPELLKIGRHKDILSYLPWVNLLRTYQKETGRICPKTREIYHGKQLGVWCCTKKTRYKKGLLTKNQCKLLEDLGLFG